MIRDNIRIIRDFFHLVKGDKKWIIQLFIASILGHISSLFLPIAASTIIKSITDQNIAIKRICNILNYSSQNIIEFGQNENDYIYGLVELKQVNFCYQEKQILKNINMRMKPNQITAIVGHTGSGKSTIINLLLRLYKLDKGMITIDGTNIYEYSKKYIRTMYLLSIKNHLFSI